MYYDGGRRLPVCAITMHLKSYGRDQFLYRSMIGGDPPEGYPEHGAWYYSDEEWTVDNQCCDGQYFDMPVPDDADRDPCGHHDVQKQFEDALQTAEELQEMTQDYENMPNEDIDETKFADTTIEVLELLHSQASHPVYPGSSVSLISVVVVLTTW